MTSVYLFAATFCLTLLIGLQSLNVRDGEKLLAAVTSLGLGGANFVLLKLVPGETDLPALLAYLAGGPAGIVVSMLLHPWLLSVFARTSAATGAGEEHF